MGRYRDIDFSDDDQESGGCSVCGRRHAMGQRCDPKLLAHIDAAHRGASLEPGIVRSPGFAERMKDAARMRRNG